MTTTRYLRLRIPANATQDARFNLERIDTLGASFVLDQALTLRVRSAVNVLIEPQSSDVGGAGTGGTVTVGHDGNQTATIVLNGTVNAGTALGVLDQGSGGTRYLRIKYKSDLSGSTDTSADRSLQVDMQGADRNFILGGNLTLAAAFSTVGAFALSLQASQATAAVMPDEAAPQLISRTSTDTLLAKTIVHGSGGNSITGLVDASIAAAAAIARSKIAAGSANHVVINAADGTLSSESALATSRGGTGVSGTATFPTSGTVATDSNALTFTNKTYDADASGNALSNVRNANVAANAAIALSKLAALTASRALVSDGSGVIGVSSVTSTELGYVAGVTSAIQSQIDAKAGRALDNLQVTGLAAGDLLRASSGTALTRIPVGSNGQYLQISGGVPVWAALGIAPAPTVSGTSAAPNLITTGSGVDASLISATAVFQTVFIAGSGGPVNPTATPQVAAGAIEGQILYLIGTHATNTVFLEDGTGLSLRGYCTMGTNPSLGHTKVLTLRWDAAANVWEEVSRA